MAAGILSINGHCPYTNCVARTHSGDRLDYKVKVELKVLYIQGVVGGVPPTPPH
jgi:hypothetical protein